MSGINKLWPILTLTVLVLLFRATPSFSFLYDGLHWDDSDLPVRWEINEDGTADCSGEFDAVRAGYQVWEYVSGIYFSETYLGTTTRGLSYPTRDGYNVVSWGDSQDPGILAVCYTWYNKITLEIVECDIEFQDYYIWSSTGELGKYDIQNIAAHEFGHTLLLGDLYGGGDTEKTMYGYGSTGETKKRTLHQDDIDGIRYIYPQSGNQPPNTPSAPSGPSSGDPGVSYSFTATTTDPDGDQIAFKFDWGDGSESGWTSFVNSGSSASMFHSWSDQGTYAVRAKAKDANGAESGWSSSHQIVTGSPPSTPSSPSGPDTGTHGPSYSFTATTSDPDGDQVAFKFDWGDGTESAWSSFVASGSSATLSHSWSGQMTYQVKAKAKDTYGGESAWSTAHDIVIGQPPATASSPSGPESGMRDASYSFSAITSDPDGDQVAFKFDWGDGTGSGWTSFVGSGESASMSHSWSGEGTYQVKVKAKDAYNAESGWSAALSITIRIILLAVDPSSLDFGELGKGSAKTMTFRAYNAGAGTLSGSITANRDWITLNPSSFAGNDNTISVTIETAGLVENLTPYSGVITITSNGGGESIEVSLLVIPSGTAAYPNPFSLSAHTNLVFWGSSIPYTKIRIFNLAGELVRVLEEKYGSSMLSWDGRNEQGNLVTRGIYIFSMGALSGKIAIK